jgi:hypothetical protein
MERELGVGDTIDDVFPVAELFRSHMVVSTFVSILVRY